MANVYRAMRDVGVADPRRVDEMELWEIAVLIGADGWKPEQQAEGASGDRYAHLRARVRARQAGEPEPTFLDAEPTADEIALMNALGGSSVG